MYMGVDGGGTKTAFVIVDGNGDEVAEHEESGSYHIDIGIAGLRALIDAGVRATLAAAGRSISDIKYAFFGLPAYGEDTALTAELDAIPSGLFKNRNYTCDNDMVCAWAGSLACQDGINIIAGTGSIGYGRYEGKAARCGGWGEVFGDEGSAYWIAVRGLQLFSKMSDGRAARGPLHGMVRKEFNLIQDLDMSAVVLGTWGSNRARIADFARLMFAAARAGDHQVANIIGSAARELVDIVDSIRESLEFPADVEVRVSYTGGVFKEGDLILTPFRNALNSAAAKYELSAPRFSPALGAAYYAAVLDDFGPIKQKLLGADA